MDFDLTDDQNSLQEVLRDVLADRPGITSELDGARWDSPLWRTLAADLGVVGLSLPESLGGAGAGLIEVALVLEELGRQVARVPYLAVTLAAEAILTCGSTEQQQDWLPQVVSGDLRPVLALAEGREAWAVQDTSVRASLSGSQWLLSGSKDHVIGVESATDFLIPARTEGGIRLFRVGAAADGVSVHDDQSIDPARPSGRLDLAGAPGEVLGDDDAGISDGLQRVRTLAQLLLAAEAVGGMARCVEAATDYARTRVQFDRPIGGFQAIKHRCADMYVDSASARALTRSAAWSLQSGQPSASVDVSLASGQALAAYYRVARENIQVHGGIGFTWEHEAHYYLKRALSSRQLLGTPEALRDETAALLGMR